MSISVKSITVSINGTQSNQFKIDIEGCRFTMSNFALRQAMLDHSRLAFNLTKAPEEDISEAQFRVCSDIIGKPLHLTLQTDMMELEMATFGGQTQVADIEFDGFITDASATRHSSQYAIRVEALSWDALLDDDRDCMTYEDKTLQEITDELLAEAAPLDYVTAPAFTAEPYRYCAKWNETTYAFLQRLAVRHGEWLFHDGRTLHFGRLPDTDPIHLAYPSRDMASYGIDMHARHLRHSHVTASSYHDEQYTELAQEKMDDMLNDLNEAAFLASTDNYRKLTMEHLPTAGFQWEIDGTSYPTDLQDRPQAQGRKAALLTYHGTTYCSKLTIGGRLVVNDNYIADTQSGQTSDVQQDEILITGITHYFSNDDTYQNAFTGISGNAQYPPYANAAAVPQARPCRAWVTDNADPEGMGRVRVTFAWSFQGVNHDRYPAVTPWIRVEQPYAGKEKGFYFIPELDEEVMVDFEGGNAEMPYVRASHYNGNLHTDKAWTAPAAVDQNEVKAIRTRNGHTIEIHDDGEGGYIKIYDNEKNNYIITLSTDKKLISLQSSGDIRLKAANNIVMEAGNDIQVTAGNDMQTYVNNDYDLTVANDAGTTVVGNHTCNVIGSHTLAVKGHAIVGSASKTEVVPGEYQFVNNNGGINMREGFAAFYGEKSVAISAKDGDVGIQSEQGDLVLHGEKNAMLTSSGNLELSAEKINMN